MEAEEKPAPAQPRRPGDAQPPLSPKCRQSREIFRSHPLYPEEEDGSLLEYEPRGDGYAPTMVPLEGERRARYEQWVSRDSASAKPREVDRYADQAFRHYVQEFRAIGVTPIFFVMPGSATDLPSRFIGTQPAA